MHHSTPQYGPVNMSSFPIWRTRDGAKERYKVVVPEFTYTSSCLDHIPAPLPHNETVIPPYNERTELGTSDVYVKEMKQ